MLDNKVKSRQIQLGDKSMDEERNKIKRADGNIETNGKIMSDEQWQRNLRESSEKGKVWNI